jgi:DNA polymerase/3'-5' exonuclease PolX
MTAKQKIPLAQARQLAQELATIHLRPACERIEVAGSVRRGKSEVSDVELVAIPRFGEQLNLFGEPASQVDLLE